MIKRFFRSIFQGYPSLLKQAVFLCNPYRRGLYFSPHWLYWASTLLGWGRILAIVVLVLYLLKPELLNHSLPGWRQSLGVAVLLFAGLGLLSNLFRFAGVILASSLWILILFLIGREVLCPELGKPALKTKSAVISSARLNSTEVNLDRGKPARVIEKRSGLRTLEGNWYQTSTFWDRINPFKITGNLFGRLFDWWSGRFNSIAASLEEKLAMSPFKAAQTLEQVRKDRNLASGKAGGQARRGAGASARSFRFAR